MDNIFDNLLPNPDEKSKVHDPELVMKDLVNSLSARYNDKILGIIASTSGIENDSPILSYTFYLVFKRHDNYSYPLFQATCIEQNGSYPLHVISHYGPPTDYGNVQDYEAFEKAIAEILQEQRTRNVILSLY
jgi:hypothetical protein